MSTFSPLPLLTTKLYMPPIQPGLIERERLLARLKGSAPHRLILVCAPAGYGKTTLVRHWLDQQGTPAPRVAWLSLDEDDNDPQQFFRYLAAAVESAVESVVEDTPGTHSHLAPLLRSPQPLPTRTLMKAFIADVTPMSARLLLVLDDYHVIESPEIDDALRLLLEHMPPAMQLVLTSRSDPALPIARLRARGELMELRADSLRFTLEEAGTFLQESMHITLTPDQIRALDGRTEGWIAGLKMAALSMQRRDSQELDGFVHSFTGSHRFVLDYLVEEILLGQPANVRTFLLATAFLDRLSGPLCQAVTGQAESPEILDHLEQANLFVVPLDDERRWYRYHHLFADVLQAHAMKEQADRIPDLHRRASEWYAAHGAPADAIRHALAAKDLAYAAGLMEVARPAFDGGYQSALWLSWVQALPNEIVRMRPVLSAGYAWALLDTGDIAGCETRLQDAERWLAAPSVEMVVVDEAQFQTLAASIAAARAYRSLALGDVPATVQHARQALDLLPDGDHHWRRAALALLGLTHWASGDVAAASRSFADLTKATFATGQIVEAFSTSYVLADMLLTLGQLRQAEGVLQHALQWATQPGHPPPLGASDLYRGMSEIHLERGELEAAQRELSTAEKLGEQAALTDWPRRLAVSQARLKQAQGDLAGALALLDTADRLSIDTPLPDVRPVAAWRALIWIAQGELGKALTWAQDHGLFAQDDLHYMREFEHITLARLLLAQGRADRTSPRIREAQALLDRLLDAAEAGGRMGSALEILVLLSLTHGDQGDTSAALAFLDRALALAEPEGYIRLFVDAGSPMLALLQAAGRLGLAPNYVGQLQAAFGNVETVPHKDQPLIEPLSDRELETLALIVAGRRNKEIAEELVISLNTVLFHIKNIYSKLGVNKRALAIAKARELDLL